MFNFIRQAPLLVMSVLVGVFAVILMALLFWPLNWPNPGYLKALAELETARSAQEQAALAATASEANRAAEDKQCNRAIAEAQAEWEADAERRANFSDGFEGILADIEDVARDLQNANQSGETPNEDFNAPGACGPLVFVPGDRLHGVEPAAGSADRAGSP